MQHANSKLSYHAHTHDNWVNNRGSNSLYNSSVTCVQAHTYRHMQRNKCKKAREREREAETETESIVIIIIIQQQQQQLITMYLVGKLMAAYYCVSVTDCVTVTDWAVLLVINTLEQLFYYWIVADKVSQNEAADLSTLFDVGGIIGTFAAVHLYRDVVDFENVIVIHQRHLFDLIFIAVCLLLSLLDFLLLSTAQLLFPALPVLTAAHVRL